MLNNLGEPAKKMRKHFALWIVALVGLVLLLPVQAQQPSGGSEKESSKPKPKKVWTGDDLLPLRTPADNYATRKQAAEGTATGQQDSSEKVAPTKTEQPANRDLYIAPKNIQEAQSRLADKREEIRNQQDSIRRAREEYLNETNELIRQDLKKRIDRFTADLKEAEAHLRLLEASLAELKSKPQPQQHMGPARQQPAN